MNTPNSQVTEQARKVQRELIEWEQQMPRVWYGNRTLLDAHNIIEDLLAAIEAALTARTEVPPAAEEGFVVPTTLVEAFSRAIYEQWSDQPGYVPWVERGNSDMQCKARRVLHNAMLAARPQPAQGDGCWCRTCRPVTFADQRFVVCPTCGNKRCPKANDHRHTCTGSNESGQPGSAYPPPPAPADGGKK